MCSYFVFLCVTLQQLKRSSEERSERYGPVQQHRRAVASLDKQIQQKAEQLKEVSAALPGISNGNCLFCSDVDASEKLLQPAHKEHRLTASFC